MERFINALIDSPGVFAQVLVTAAALAVSAGLVITDANIAAAVAVLFAVSGLLGSLYGRSKTVPQNRVIEYVDRK